jgi:hypothetical protein
MIVDAFDSANWPKPALIFEHYLHEQHLGDRFVWVFGADNQVSGYVSLKWQSDYWAFQDQGIPEIMDLNVLPAFRNIGLGSMLFDIGEKKAPMKSKVVGFGVGLYGGCAGAYGRGSKTLSEAWGYISDGKGVL